MMIRINLLPVKQAQKRELGRQWLILGVVVLAGSVIINYLWWNGRVSTGDRLDKQITDIRSRIAELEKAIGEVNNINMRKKEVTDKLKVLSDLRKKRSGPVRMLDALATATPHKVTLGEFAESNGTVRITGRATSHEDVSDFMRNLTSMVWCKKGMAKVIEHKRDSPTLRVQYFKDDSQEDVPLTEAANFFTQIELKQDTLQQDTKVPTARVVTFEIDLSANYAI
jgi:type IV pilus assembly protein PilN